MIEIEQKPAPVEVTSPIKPSEALRLGRLQFPIHAAGRFWSRGSGGACAVGAMMAGFGADPRRLDGADWITARAVLQPFGLDPNDFYPLFDQDHERGHDGDAAVLAYLQERGL